MCCKWNKKYRVQLKGCSGKQREQWILETATFRLISRAALFVKWYERIHWYERIFCEILRTHHCMSSNHFRLRNQLPYDLDWKNFGINNYRCNCIQISGTAQAQIEEGYLLGGWWWRCCKSIRMIHALSRTYKDIRFFDDLILHKMNADKLQTIMEGRWLHRT